MNAEEGLLKELDEYCRVYLTSEDYCKIALWIDEKKKKASKK